MRIGKLEILKKDELNNIKNTIRVLEEENIQKSQKVNELIKQNKKQTEDIEEVKSVILEQAQKIKKSLPYGVYNIGNLNKTISKNTTLTQLISLANELPNAPQSIDYIKRTVFARGYELIRKDNKKEDKGKEELLKFFDNVNDNNEDIVDVMQNMIVSMLQTGDGFIEKVFDSQNTPKLKQLYNVSAYNMAIQVNKDKEETGIIEILNYVKVKYGAILDENNIKGNELSKEEVIHAKYMGADGVGRLGRNNANSGEGAYGISPFEKNITTSYFIMNILDVNNKKFKNEIKHNLWINIKNGNQEDVTAFTHSYSANYLNENNRGKPLITTGVEVTELTDITAKTEYFEFMRTKGETHAPSLLGVAYSEISNEHAKYNNASQGHVSTILNTINPLQDKIEKIVNNEIIPLLGLSDNYIFKINRENISANYESIDGITRAVQSAIIRPNEARQLINAKSLSAVDEEWANSFFVKLGNEVKVFPHDFFGGDSERY